MENQISEHFSDLNPVLLPAIEKMIAVIEAGKVPLFVRRPGASIMSIVRRYAESIGSVPLRAPHWTISEKGLMGSIGGAYPGEVERADGGVLLIDEAPEFARAALVSVARAYQQGYVEHEQADRTWVKKPVKFKLILAMNPCPCGHAGNPNRSCVCHPDTVERYLQRVAMIPDAELILL